MEYPIIPIAIASKSNIQKMQVVQNAALRQAVRGTDDRHPTIKEIQKNMELKLLMKDF